jgi:hypothetical protein
MKVVMVGELEDLKYVTYIGYSEMFVCITDVKNYYYSFREL